MHVVDSFSVFSCSRLSYVDLYFIVQKMSIVFCKVTRHNGYRELHVSHKDVTVNHVIFVSI